MPLQNNISQIIQELGIDSWFHAHSPKIHRHVELRHNAIFDALVGLYRPVFQVHWYHLKDLVEHSDHCANCDKDPLTYVTAVYISAWFHDLYVSNRKACLSLSDDEGFLTYYFLELFHNGIKYDKFLTLLSEQIRPTKVKYAHGEGLFIPIISSKLDANAKDGNYFGIDGWVRDDACLWGIVDILENYNLMPQHRLPDEIYGKPTWLFDWHADGLAYAWFPPEVNHSRDDDILLAFVLGEACTSTLAIGDYDEWQEFPEKEIPAEINPWQCSRVRPVGCACAEVVRTVETRHWKPSKEMMLIEEDKGNKKRKQVDLACPVIVDGPGIAEFRVVDWVYNACVITHADKPSRSSILWKIIRSG